MEYNSIYLIFNKYNYKKDIGCIIINILGYFIFEK